MKKYFITALILLSGMMGYAQSIRVLSNVRLGEGFIPHISADGAVVQFIADPQTEYPEAQDADLYVTNEDLHLYLYQDGVRHDLKPHGDNAYIWGQLSPNKQMILFHSHRGTAVCDLQGRVLYELGELINPAWYDDAYVVGAHTESDGHEYTNSRLVLRALTGQEVELTDGTQIDMFPQASAASGRIVYNTLSGDIRMLQLNLTDLPVSRSLPRMQAVMPHLQAAPAQKAPKKNFSDVKIYINPGHGGYTGNDRGMFPYPFHQGDTTSFWESSSNLHKGLMLDSMLRALGVQTRMSRTRNTEADDLDLHVIVAEANAYGADFMLSIHSNAGGPSNYILQLYSGKDADDPITYADYGTKDADSRAISTVIGNNLHQSTPLSSWTRVPYIVGDKTFARKIMGWSNGYGVLRYLRVPGEISEGGMHDYIPQTYRLLNMDYKRMEAYAFARSFLTYFLDYHYPTGVIGGQVRDSYEPMSFPVISRNAGPDINKPILGATVELVQNGSVIRTYTTDSLYNGVYFFWDLVPGDYVVRAFSPDHYVKEMPVTVTADQVAYQNMMIDRKRNTPPTIVSYTPCVASITDSVLVSTVISFTFNWDMQADSTMAAFSVSPEVEGTLSMSRDNRTLTFEPARRFEPGVEYTVTLSTTACHPDTLFANHLQAPFVFSFRTLDRANMRFVQSYPAEDDNQVPVNASFVAMFDQKLASYADIRVEDAAGNVLAKNTRSVSINKAPSPYGYITFDLINPMTPNTDYCLVIGPDMKDNLGIYFGSTKRIPFHTAAEQTITLPLVDPVDSLCLTYDAESSRGTVSGSTLRNTNKKYSGTASTELSYKFADDAKPTSEAYFPMKNPSLLAATCHDEVGMYVYSDYSGNALYAVYGVEGDLRYAKVCDLDYVGWKFQTVDLSVLPEGIEYQMIAMKVTYEGALLSQKGTIYLDNFYLLKDAHTALEDAEADLTPDKCIEDNQLIIRRDGRRFNALGTELRSR